MSIPSQNNQANATQAHALGTYRHDVAYTAALKSGTQALGSYRYDIPYTGALKSVQQIDHQGALVFCDSSIDMQWTGVTAVLTPVLFYGVKSVWLEGAGAA